MRNQALSFMILLLLSSSALGQSYDMTVHLSTGETITIPINDIQRIEFANILIGVQDPDSAPRTLKLLQNHPNPFNPLTTIAYEIPDRAHVTVRIYDLNGALIKELLNKTQAVGRHQVTWDGTDSQHARVASGVYLYSVACGKETLCRQLVLVK